MFQSLDVVLENCEVLEINKNDILDCKIIKAIPYDFPFQKLDVQDKYYKKNRNHHRTYGI